MRALVLVLLSAFAVLAEDPQTAPSASATPLPDNLSIPAQLSKSLDTNKCKVGDVIEMKTLEPVLLGNNLVMPEKTKLLGTIVGAASRQDEKPSWILLVVERADWKEHSVALHAFVSSQITVRAETAAPTNSTLDRAMNLSDTVQRRHVRQLPQGAGTTSAGPMARTLGDAGGGGSDPQQSGYQTLDDLRILQDKQGRVFLVSAKAHLKLPSGTMFMLRNQATAVDKEVDVTRMAGIEH
jgi:hypothetical protein